MPAKTLRLSLVGSGGRDQTLIVVLVYNCFLTLLMMINTNVFLFYFYNDGKYLIGGTLSGCKIGGYLVPRGFGDDSSTPTWAGGAKALPAGFASRIAFQIRYGVGPDKVLPVVVKK